MTKNRKMLLRGIGIGIIITATFYYMVISFSQVNRVENINENYPEVIEKGINENNSKVIEEEESTE